jgi:hypothetical protein
MVLTAIRPVHFQGAYGMALGLTLAPTCDNSELRAAADFISGISGTNLGNW